MRRTFIGAVLAALAFSVLPASPASAVAVGQIAFQGNAALPTFPCTPPPPFGTGPCHGTLDGQWSGEATGTVAGGEFHVTWIPQPLHADFSYYELQCVEPSTLLGAAFGTGWATAGPGSIRGDWQGASGLPRAITDLRLDFRFQWTRVGTSAAITFSAFDLSANISGLGWQRLSYASPLATATFVPLTVDNVHPPTCLQPLTNVRGVVAGQVTLAG